MTSARIQNKNTPLGKFLFNLRDFCKQKDIEPAIASVGCMQFAALIARAPANGKAISWWGWMRMASKAYKQAGKREQ